VSPRSCTEKKWTRGEPRNYLHGHNTNGADNPLWKGGTHVSKGYINIYCPNHPRKKGAYVSEHILIAEKVLGKYLPDKAVVHHSDGNGLNNTNNNLVVCQNEAYHRILHQRKRAFEASGHALWRKCRYCKKYDDTKNLRIGNRKGASAYHKVCANNYQKELNIFRSALNCRRYFKAA